ncbi:non-hydrolyzing UDP-N-acetylglucosamine 2-epimerase [Salinigranum rubrum]|uniref:non-hydrolyzing UDP-N-acetylglucosamine 2-epimerase n=1 Tax=Salinigranum rubrum TaxID=755307 RepID=UPI001FE4F163|nr:UDP-N-acetylglucosamine 2-epimerase (non-hydrolyzing) [Salinigranum rubrum]
MTVVIGTRPELIKMAPVIKAIRETDSMELRFVHTGQHYDTELSGSFIRTLGLPEPDVRLGVGSGSQAEQTGEALVALEADVEATSPDVVLAQGDTNAVLSAALAVSKLDADFGHVEAGIRSFDDEMPEEVNRVVADRVADFLFAPTMEAAQNLTEEGITENVHVTGNTVVDACREHSKVAHEQSDVLDRLDLTPGEYVAATVHRARNTDDDDRLRTVLTALDDVSFPVVLPAHPRTQAAVDRIGFDASGSLALIDPLDYLDFLELLSSARVVVTDSGGVQEEASILEVPCLTVRPNTERPETVDAGVNELVTPETVGDRLRAVYRDERDEMVGATDLFGDGRAGERIVELLRTAGEDDRDAARRSVEQPPN